MSKKTANKIQTQPPPVKEEKRNFLTMFSKIDSRERHRILAYIFWLLGMFIILFAYRIA